MIAFEPYCNRVTSKAPRAAGPLWAGLAAVAAAVAMTAVVAAAKPAAGRATGSFAVDGKPVTFAHAYAQVEVDSGGKDVLWVLLTFVDVSLWLAFGLLLSVVVRRAATSALIGFGAWLLLTFFGARLRSTR